MYMTHLPKETMAMNIKIHRMRKAIMLKLNTSFPYCKIIQYLILITLTDSLVLS